MDIRNALNRNPAIVTGSVLVLVVITLWLIFGQSSSMSRSTFEGMKAFYSDDDGQTWFTDSLVKSSPFDHNGKQAFRVYVYECNGVAKVRYLERVASRNDVPAVIKGGYTPPNTGSDALREIKRPGEKQWVPFGYPEAHNIRFVKCEGGGQAKSVLANEANE